MPPNLGASGIQATATTRSSGAIASAPHISYVSYDRLTFWSQRGAKTAPSPARASPPSNTVVPLLDHGSTIPGRGTMRRSASALAATSITMEDHADQGLPITHRMVEANGISMHVAEAGPEAGKVVLFLHGFAELWYSWRHQMRHLAALGYRCVAPDLRGYGDTDAPTGVECYTAFHLVGDVVGLLDALGVHKVFVVGHDWGALIAWYMCLFRPDRVTALVNTSVAFMRHVLICTGGAAIKPTQHFNRAYGPNYYICRFQEPGLAEKTLSAAHARQHVLGNLCGNRFREGSEKLAELPSWLTQNDIDYFVMAFHKTGFTGGINYYRNLDSMIGTNREFRRRTPNRLSIYDALFLNWIALD